MIKKIVLIFFVVFSINANSLDGVYSEWVKDSATQMEFWIEKSVDKRTSVKWIGSTPASWVGEITIQGELEVYLDGNVVERFKGKFYSGYYGNNNSNRFHYLFGERTRYKTEFFNEESISSEQAKGIWRDNAYIELGLFNSNKLTYLCDSIEACNKLASGQFSGELLRRLNGTAFSEAKKSELSESLARGREQQKKEFAEMKANPQPASAINSSSRPIADNFEEISNNFDNLNNTKPNFLKLRQLFQNVKPLQEGQCSNGIMSTIAKLMSNASTRAFDFSHIPTSWSYQYPLYEIKSNLTKFNQDTAIDYSNFRVNKVDESLRIRGLAIVTNAACNRVFIQSEVIGIFSDGSKYHSTAYSEVFADFSKNYTSGIVKNKSFDFATNGKNTSYSGVTPEINFLCTRDKCFSGTVESVFTQNVLSSADDWSSDIKSSISALEVQRDTRLKQETIRREKEAQEQRIAQEKENKRIQLEESKFNAVLANKNPQAMYLAAGTYARNGERGRASEIYEKIISRFPKSNWAVKASDQLSDFRRADEGDNRRYEESSRNRQTCENQKNACLAQCPPRAEGFRLDSSARNQCVFTCERISCN